MLQKFETWTVKDRHPELPLQDITRISHRAFSFVSRNMATLNPKDGAMNLLGVLDILEALDYHFDNFINLKNSDVEINQRHEAVAYLNRIGQLYYFTLSDFTARHIPNAISYMSKVNDLKVFRMKSTAHRSLDFPKGESEEYQNRQALTMLGATNSKVLGKLEYILPVQNKSTKKTEWHFFTPETDHEIVMTQSYKLIELIIDKIIQ
ncbi:hypothetical protein [uncultured Roseivirga sp.]|uniref:hypothetical protein n=1 Tax=uncultured Roseivirga sp. TaxID=543088 RepID=UPI0030DA5DA5